MENLKLYQYSNDLGDKELKFKYFQMEVADISNYMMNEFNWCYWSYFRQFN